MIKTNHIFENYLSKMIFSSLLVLSLFMFTAFSFMAVFHILILLPAIYFTYVTLKNNTYRPSLSTKMLMIVIVIDIISVLAAPDIAKPIKNIFKLKYFLVALLSIPALSFYLNRCEKKTKILLLKIYLFSTTLVTVVGIIALYTGYNYLRMTPSCHECRACGMYGMYMSYGYGLQFFLIIVLGILLEKKHSFKLPRFWLVAVLIINGVGLYLSYDRGAILAMICAIPFFMFKQNKKLFVYGIVGAIILLVSSFLFVPKVKELVYSAKRMHSLEIRLAQYETAIMVAKEKPFFGIGYRNFEPNVKALKEKWKIPMAYFSGDAHSNFFEQLASTGFIGLLFLLLFHIFWFKEMYARDDIIGKIGIPFVVSLFVSGQFQATLWDGENLFLIMFFYSISQINFKSKKESL